MTKEIAANDDRAKIQLLKLREENGSKMHQKLHSLLENAEDPRFLEAIGKKLTFAELKMTLSFFAKKDLPISKLGPLFVGISFDTFFCLLEDLQPHELHLLQEASALEPIYHHLLLLTHHYEAVLQENRQLHVQLEGSIQALYLKDVTSSEIFQMKHALDCLRNQNLKSLSLLNTALLIAWPSGQEALVDSLSRLKEMLHHLIAKDIGHPKMQHELASGLYLTLENHLATVFLSNEGNSFSALKDEESPLEALAKFGIWHLTDYWELGLLPEVKTEEGLSEILKSQDLDTAVFYRDAVEKRLKQIGLENIKAFKEKHIVSKSTLNDFLKNVLF